MQKIRGKDMIKNKSPYLRRSKKKKKQEESDDLLSVLSLDLKTEIFLKLPAKSVAKLNLVSNRLSSIIRAKVFTDLYLARSLAKPRLLFTVINNDSKYFLSCPQEDFQSDHVKVNISALTPDDWCEFSPPVRGLICGHNDADVWIVNPSTGQFLNLPRLRTKGQFLNPSINAFFGYDPVNEEYKVLCMTVGEYGSRDVSDDHQVFTLGAQQKEWRSIKCKHPRRPSCASKGLCMNGVVYYYAWIKLELSLISFDLRSEEFHVVKLPKVVRLANKLYSLVNYSGKVALTHQHFNGRLDVRVLEDANEQEWSKFSVVIPSWEELAGDDEFSLKGALSTGELIFATMDSIYPFYIISYNIKENNAKRVMIEGIVHSFDMFLDHVDSPMFLSNVSFDD